MHRGSIALTALVSLLATGCAAPDAPRASPAVDGPYEPAPAERDRIVAALQTVFDALRTGDGDLLRSASAPDLVMTHAETGSDGETSFGSSTLEGLATRIETSAEPLVERMWDPVVRVSGSMATIWTPYDFYVGTTFSHCGVDAATLMRGDEGWKIVSLSWTRLQPPECPLHPDGPPNG